MGFEYNVLAYDLQYYNLCIIIMCSTLYDVIGVAVPSVHCYCHCHLHMHLVVSYILTHHLYFSIIITIYTVYIWRSQEVFKNQNFTHGQ